MKITSMTKLFTPAANKTASTARENSTPAQNKTVTLAGAAVGAALMASVMGCGPKVSWTPYQSDKPQMFSNEIYNETNGYDPYEPNATTQNSNECNRPVVREPLAPADCHSSDNYNDGFLLAPPAVEPYKPAAGDQQVLEDVTVQEYESKHGDAPKAQLNGDDILLDAPADNKTAPEQNAAPQNNSANNGQVSGARVSTSSAPVRCDNSNKEKKIENQSPYTLPSQPKDSLPTKLPKPEGNPPEFKGTAGSKC